MASHDQGPQPPLPRDDKPEPGPEARGQDEDGPETPPASRLSRRDFVLRFMAVLGGIAAALVAIPTGAFMSAPGWLSTAPRRLLSETISPALRSDEWSSAGPIDSLKVGEPKYTLLDRLVVDGWVKRIEPVGVFLVRNSDTDVTVFDPHCTHLGCPVSWASGSKSFLSPCHGGVFDVEGNPTAGPPPRRLDVYETRVDDGEVMVGKLLDSV